MSNPYFELIRHDITEPVRLEIEQIYHLASPASPVHYQYLDYSKIAEWMDQHIVIDGRNFLNPETMVHAGFQYVGVGRWYGMSQDNNWGCFSLSILPNFLYLLVN